MFQSPLFGSSKTDASWALRLKPMKEKHQTVVADATEEGGLGTQTDSLQNLKNRARLRRRVQSKVRTYWFSQEETAAGQKVAAVDTEARAKAIQDLLSMGCDHFSGEQDTSPG